MPTTLFVAINAVINAVRMIDHVVVLTRGGPDLDNFARAWASAPLLLAFILFQRQFVQSFMRAGIK